MQWRRWGVGHGLGRRTPCSPPHPMPRQPRPPLATPTGNTVAQRHTAPLAACACARFVENTSRLGACDDVAVGAGWRALARAPVSAACDGRGGERATSCSAFARFVPRALYPSPPACPLMRLHTLDRPQPLLTRADRLVFINRPRGRRLRAAPSTSTRGAPRFPPRSRPFGCVAAILGRRGAWVWGAGWGRCLRGAGQRGCQHAVTASPYALPVLPPSQPRCMPQPH